MTRSDSTRRVALTAVLALATAAFVGCTADRHTYKSTPTAPKSVAVSYIETGETAWSKRTPEAARVSNVGVCASVAP